MNIGEVIEELKKYPAHLPVRGFMTCVYYSDEHGESEINPDSTEAQEVTDIQWRGKDILLACGGLVAE